MQMVRDITIFAALAFIVAWSFLFPALLRRRQSRGQRDCVPASSAHPKWAVNPDLWHLPPKRDDRPSLWELPASYWRSHAAFPRQMTRVNWGKLTEMIRVIDDLFRRHNFTYMMIYGTLAGSYFHHGIIPWDAGVDLTAEFGKRKEILMALRTLDSVYGFHFSYEALYRLIVYRTDGNDDDSPWTRPPTVNILLFLSDGHSMWNYANHCLLFPLKDIFPLTMRPYGPLWLPSPRNAKAVVSINQTLSTTDRQRCFIRGSNFWHFEIAKETNCSNLHSKYPFVVERQSAQSPWISVETLMIDGAVLQKVSIPLPGF